MKSNLDKYFVLFSCCFITKGFNRSIIIDTQRNNFHFIPHELGDLIGEFPVKTTGQIMQQFAGDEERGIFNEYLMFLESNELGFYTNNPPSFPRIDESFRLPNVISNAVLDFRKDIPYPVESHLQELETLGCEAVQIRIFENLTQPIFTKLIESFEKISFRCVDLLLNADVFYNRKYLKSVLKSNPNINKVTLYNSSKGDFVILNHYQSLELKTSALNSKEQCGQMGAKYFVTNLNHVIESRSFNSCLNKKIAIDEDGLIKNCPSLKQTFGDAQETSLTEAIEKKGFKNLWSLGKDKVEVCKDCEFRYICTDCRAYIQNADNEFSKPIKCGYDPYSNIWEDWSLNSLSTIANNI
jgi:SPASM domain peptide maturase of grasp-with-spasm system